MENKNIYWKKVSPVELSGLSSGRFLAFSSCKQIFHLEEIAGSCPFTKIIQAASSYSRSIYGMDIWMGYKSENSSIGNNEVIENLKQFTGCSTTTGELFKLGGGNKFSLNF